MIEKILENIVNEMAPYLDQGQLEHLSNALYINFHGKEIQEQCTELVPSGMDGDMASITFSKIFSIIAFLLVF